jgi:hypothetical protein
LDLNRQSIERRDFPLARRGYDQAAVNAHLQALTAAVQELSQRAAAATGEQSLSSAAATRVQGILEAAQATAAEIGREAERDAQQMREQAAQDVERARTHVETLAQASTALLARVEALDNEVSTLAQSLRGGREETSGEQEQSAPATVVPAGEQQPSTAPAATVAQVPAPPSVPDVLATPSAPPAPLTTPQLAPEPVQPAGGAPPAPQPPLSTDLDGARLVALNMALGGEPREQTDRYLADSFQIPDRAKLLDEVYAAVEG